ncbi:MAG TPA: methyltransferase domain-containing protein [Gemmatimonadales bacterium]|nr:methyltransferase domain-containing protein [Gemmatimonadales bacterium]
MTHSLLTPVGDELLDHPDADPAVVASSLHHIARANFWFGGWWAVRRGLARLLAEAPRGSRFTLLDVGTGNGDLPARAVAWAARRGITLTPIGLERHRTAAGLANRRGVRTLLGCAGALPVRPRSVDIVLASQLVHHLSPAANVAFFRAAHGVARLGVVIADLRRSPLALAGFWVGSRLFRFDRATRSDGLTSVLRGFLPHELTALLGQAGISATVERSPGFRLVASWRAG